MNVCALPADHSRDLLQVLRIAGEYRLSPPPPRRSSTCEPLWTSVSHALGTPQAAALQGAPYLAGCSGCPGPLTPGPDTETSGRYQTHKSNFGLRLECFLHLLAPSALSPAPAPPALPLELPAHSLPSKHCLASAGGAGPCRLAALLDLLVSYNSLGLEVFAGVVMALSTAFIVLPGLVTILYDFLKENIARFNDFVMEEAWEEEQDRNDEDFKTMDPTDVIELSHVRPPPCPLPGSAGQW